MNKHKVTHSWKLGACKLEGSRAADPGFPRWDPMRV